jgi:hypothetical protein
MLVFKFKIAPPGKAPPDHVWLSKGDELEATVTVDNALRWQSRYTALEDVLLEFDYAEVWRDGERIN